MIVAGNIQYPLHLVAPEYIPLQVRRKVDETTISVLENGFIQFYTSISDFITEFRLKQILSDEIDNSYSLTVDHLKIPLAIYFVLLALASIIFAIEKIIYRLKMRNVNGI